MWHFYLLRSVGKGAFGKVSPPTLSHRPTLFAGCTACIYAIAEADNILHLDSFLPTSLSEPPLAPHLDFWKSRTAPETSHFNLNYPPNLTRRHIGPSRTTQTNENPLRSKVHQQISNIETTCSQQRSSSHLPLFLSRLFDH